MEQHAFEPRLGPAVQAAPLAIVEPAPPPPARPLSDRTRRHAARDVLRLQAIERLVSAGTPLVDSTWQTISGASPFAYAEFRAPDARRPSDAALLRRYANLTARVAPEAVEQAHHAAALRLANAADEAAGVVTDLMRGDFGTARVRTRGEVVEVEADSGAARVKLESAALVLRSVGLGSKSGDTTNATQVNVTGNVFERRVERSLEAKWR